MSVVKSNFDIFGGIIAFIYPVEYDRGLFVVITSIADRGFVFLPRCVCLPASNK